MTTVDIVVATYDRADILPKALNSIQNQTFSDWVCWIAEDGETRETYEAIRPFLKDDRFRYLSCEHTSSPATPRNCAILQGEAPYIAFLDDDDLWLPEKLECQMEFMKKHLKCVLLGTNAYRWPGSAEWDRSLPLYFNKSIEGKIPYKKLVKVNRIIASSVVICREVISYSGVFNDDDQLRAFEDYELWLRIGSLGQIWLMHEPFVAYRDSPTLSLRSKTDVCNYNQTIAKVFESALRGAGGVASPLSYPENARYAVLCRRERDYYITGRKPLSGWNIIKRFIVSTKEYIFSRL